jgi:hypothetical protein
MAGRRNVSSLGYFDRDEIGDRPGEDDPRAELIAIDEFA